MERSGRHNPDRYPVPNRSVDLGRLFDEDSRHSDWNSSVTVSTFVAESSRRQDIQPASVSEMSCCEGDIGSSRSGDRSVIAANNTPSSKKEEGSLAHVSPENLIPDVNELLGEDDFWVMPDGTILPANSPKDQ